MRLRSRWTAASAAVLLVAGGVGYVVADVRDVVPGLLTGAPLPEPPPPFPEAPGASPGAPAAAVLPPVGTDAPLPDPAVLAATVGPLLDAPALGASVGTVVVDGLTGQVLLDDDALTPREPASVAKLLTGAAALSRLGPDTTIPTRAVTGIAPDEVVLVGGGDLLLAAGAGDPRAANGRAGLADLADSTAASLLAQGRTTVAVRVDDSLFTGPALAPGVTSADVAAGFVAPTTSIAVDAGRIRPGVYEPRVADLALSAAATFAALLAERGVVVVGEPARAVAPPDAAVLGEVRSAPVADVVAYVLGSSDNDVAEALARLVAVEMGRATAFGDAARAVLDEVAGLGVDVSGATLADGSGLGDGSRLPAALLGSLLATAASEEHPELRPLLTGLPVAGLSGTLTERFAAEGGGAGVGVVRAKTGSLTGVTSLAGTVRDVDGRLLAFAVLADQAPATGPAREASDTVAATLATCGCR